MYLVIQKNKNDLWKKYYSLKHKTYQSSAYAISRAIKANEFIALYFEDGKMAGYIETWKLLAAVGSLLTNKHPLIDLESWIRHIVKNSSYDLDDSEKERRTNQAAKMRQAKQTLADNKTPDEKTITTDSAYINPSKPNPYL